MSKEYEFIEFDVVFCNQKDFDFFYGDFIEDFDESSNFTINDFSNEWQMIQNEVRKDLSKFWVEDCYGNEDFSLMDNYNCTFHKAGGVYSERIICREFIQVIIKAISKSKHPEKWVFHFTSENNSLYNEFFIKNSQVYTCGLKKLSKHLMKSKLKPVSLHRSVELDNFNWVKQMYKPGLFYWPALKDEKGNLPQHYLKSTSVAEFLNERGFDFNMTNDRGQTVLDKVINKEPWQYELNDLKPSLCKYLIQNGAKTSFEINYPLHYYSLLGTTNDIKRELLRNDVTKVDSSLCAPPLIYALRSGRVSKIQLLLKNGADITQTADDGDSILVVGYNFNISTRIFKLLINNKANVNARSTIHNNAPILHLVCKNTIDQVKLLLDSGANINGRDADGSTAAFYTEGENGVEILRLLHSRGLDFSLKNKEGKTCMNHFAEWVEYFSYDKSLSSKYMKLALTAQELIEEDTKVTH